jgi:hypothetical protein
VDCKLVRYCNIDVFLLVSHFLSCSDCSNLSEDKMPGCQFSSQEKCTIIKIWGPSGLVSWRLRWRRLIFVVESFVPVGRTSGIVTVNIAKFCKFLRILRACGKD